MRVNGDAVRVLLVEDDEDDYLMTRDLLRDGFGSAFSLEWTASPEAGLEQLTSGQYDVALLDYHLGGVTGIDLLRSTIAQGCSTPVIMLTGHDSRTTDLGAMHAGAADYLVKGRVTGDMLERAIRYARERHRLLEQIRVLSLTDELTGLHNRRAFLAMADQRLQLLERTGSLCLLIFADVDGLKHTNDTIGHEAGDRLLVDTAGVLQGTFRRTDLIARLGGDEFVVLAQIADGDHVQPLLDKLQHQIGSRNTPLDAETPPLSISVGALCFRTGPGVRLQEIIAEADARMLQCKATRHGSRAARPAAFCHGV